MDDILTFPRSQGGQVRILPLAIATAAEETPGVASCQVIQREPLKLTVRLSVKKPDGEQAVWDALRERLGTYLAEQGVSHVLIEKAAEPPQLHPQSGKFRQVCTELKH